MNIYEYQAKTLLRDYGLPLLRGKMVCSSEEAEDVVADLGGDLWVVKAQIHAGGRGKAGGVILCQSGTEVTQEVRRLLEYPLVTTQTGPKGQKVRHVYIEAGCAIAQEFYISLGIDRSHHCIAFLVSRAGGIDIEEVAQKTPEKILKILIDPAAGFQPYHGRKIACSLGLQEDAACQMEQVARKLYAAFIELDASLIEINPLVVTKQGELRLLDAKMTFDESGLFRHPQLAALRDEEQEDPAEREAARQELSYIKLEGDIGCMVNGAGLAMATMDIIQLEGIRPANFLDVGGGASREKVTAAFELIVADPNVKAILINIFGGIMRCDVVAEGIIAAARHVNLGVPVVVRLQGTHEQQGRQLLADSGLSIITADDLAEAAARIARLVRKKNDVYPH